MKTLKLSLIIVSWSFFLINSTAQIGYSSASVSQVRANGIVSSSQIVVEEYMNYHKHNITMPADNEEIALDIQWGNKYINKNTKHAVLQVGIATESFDDYLQIPSLNIALVIDKSGSMSSDNRLKKVKIALKEFVKSLRPNDIISIVTYDHVAETIYPSQKVGNGNLLKMAIMSIQTGGSTNLNAGMVLGYEEALKNFNKTGTNKVILLTDGCANTGVTNQEDILKNSSKYNQKGIGISTIGVGYGVNHDLLRQISQNGKGANHFIGAGEDIQKVFIDEVESLLSPIAKNVELELEFSNNLQLSHVYGYAPKLFTNKVSFELSDINSSLTQVFIVKFDTEKVLNQKSAEVTVRFKYFDIKAGKNKEITKKLPILVDQNSPSNFLANREVKRNYTIALMAQCLKNMALSYESGKHDKAKQLVDNCIKEVYNYYPRPKEKNITRVLELVKKYRLELTKELAQDN